MNKKMNKELSNILTGKTEEHLGPILNNGAFLLHQEALADFYSLRQNCKNEGFDLEVVSSFRSFERQLLIWNNKAQGKRDILDSNSNKLNFKDLSPKDLVLAILRWSALPGMSRHHWGTDFDVIDKNKMTKNYKLQLIPEETNPSGIFGELHLYLDKIISNKEAFQFYRPYEKDLGGVAPEKWHLSYSPVSKKYLENLSFEFFDQFLKEQSPNEFFLLDTIISMKEEIYERFIVNLSRQPL